MVRVEQGQLITQDDVLYEVALDLLPGARAEDCSVVRAGQFHDVVLAPGTGAVRIARGPGRTAAFERVAALTRRLDTLDLPFGLPVPLGPVVEHDGRAALATRWLAGEPAPRGSPRVDGVRRLLAAMTDVDVAELEGLLAAPHAYAGGDRWEEVLLEEVVPRLPRRLRDDARRRVHAVLVLEATPAFVHGDLAGDNVLWDGDHVVGVLDWDLAAAWDPAVDVACLAWHGWETIGQVVGRGRTYARARTWYRVFGLEQIAADLLADVPQAELDARVARIVDWLDRTTPDA